MLMKHRKDAQLSMVIGFSQQPNEVDILIFPILQIRKLSQKEIKYSA